MRRRAEVLRWRVRLRAVLRGRRLRTRHVLRRKHVPSVLQVERGLPLDPVLRPDYEAMQHRLSLPRRCPMRCGSEVLRRLLHERPVLRGRRLWPGQVLRERKLRTLLQVELGLSDGSVLRPDDEAVRDVRLPERRPVWRGPALLWRHLSADLHVLLGRRLWRRQVLRERLVPALLQVQRRLSVDPVLQPEHAPMHDGLPLPERLAVRRGPVLRRCERDVFRVLQDFG